MHHWGIMLINIRNKKGFTLLELLMVIIVVGILTSFAIPQYQSFLYKAHVAEAHRLLGVVIRAEQQFFLEHGTYTHLIDDLDVVIDSNFWKFSVNLTGAFAMGGMMGRAPNPANSVVIKAEYEPDKDSHVYFVGINTIPYRTVRLIFYTVDGNIVLD